jgi:SpoVK/Ycf46/Vps4 family AAA+-type ATPase
VVRKAALYDKYVGETERNLRQALDTADAMSPVVLWIDEIEKGFPRDGGEADGGGERAPSGYVPDLAPGTR